MRNLLLAIAAAIGSGPALAQPSPEIVWDSIHRGDGLDFAINSASLRRDAAGFSLTVRLIYDEIQEDGEKSVTMSTRYECASRRSTVTQATVFASDNAVIAQADIPPEAQRSEVAAPNSPNTLVFDRYCR